VLHLQTLLKSTLLTARHPAAAVVAVCTGTADDY
jgi:hypothetical protein